MAKSQRSNQKNLLSKNDYYLKSTQTIDKLPRPKLLTVIAHFDLPNSTEEIVNDPHNTITKMLKHNNICTQLIRKYGGIPTKELGDAVLAEFMTFPQAILCAKEAITYLKNSKCKICTKVSISLGRIEKIKTRKEPDVYGIPVNLCSRMSGIVDDDSIIIEESRLSECMPLLGDTLIKLGNYTDEEFHGFPEKIRVRQITFIN
jgi:class 3 adenylate cyclase